MDDLPPRAAESDSGDSIRASLIVSESHHRITNNLASIIALIRLYASDVGRRETPMHGHEVETLLLDISTRVETINALHGLLAREPETRQVDLGAYLGRICSMLEFSMCADDRMKIARRLEPFCIVSVDTITSLAIVVGELVTNALKHARPATGQGTVTVSSRRDAGRLVVEVCDDGAGLPAGFDPDTDGRIGFEVVRMLSRQLGGTIAFASTRTGLCVRLVLPPHAA